VVGLIPAAGRASRLAPLPCSKELLPVGFQTAAEGADRKPKPVSQYLLERMKLAGAGKIFFIARQGKWDIADYYADGSRLGLQLAYLHVGAPWGPPFTLTQAAPFIGDADVVFGSPTSSSTRRTRSTRCSRECKRPAPTWCSASSIAAPMSPVM
jgi:glucose-1-phosphate thymidylyltransferase